MAFRRGPALTQPASRPLASALKPPSSPSTIRVLQEAADPVGYGDEVDAAGLTKRVQRVGRMPRELLEAIFVNVDTPQLLCAVQLVCRDWQVRTASTPSSWSPLSPSVQHILSTSFPHRRLYALLSRTKPPTPVLLKAAAQIRSYAGHCQSVEAILKHFATLRPMPRQSECTAVRAAVLLLLLPEHDRGSV